jgi:N-methylhydantoinase B/oxoprolinase/acetone carboxylase alpha subunit
MSRISYDLNQPEFTDEVRAVLRSMIDKHEQYERQGRMHEANAMAKAFRITKRAYKADFEDTEPTGWGSL